MNRLIENSEREKEREIESMLQTNQMKTEYGVEEQREKQRIKTLKAL